MKRTKRVWLVLLSIMVGIGMLFLVGAVLAGVFAVHPLREGHLLEAVAFEDGSALTVSRVDQGTAFLIMGYYDVVGNEIEGVDLPLSGEPETVIVQVCGGFVQVFAGYVDQTAERFVFQLPEGVGEGCGERVFLPVVMK